MLNLFDLSIFDQYPENFTELLPIPKVIKIANHGNSSLFPIVSFSP